MARPGSKFSGLARAIFGGSSFGPTIGASAVHEAQLADASVTNAKVAAAAAIAYPKLNLSGSIVNGDVAAGAAIAYSKLNLSSSITHNDVAAANKDGAAGTASMRTIGTGALQACAGNDARLADQRVPTDGSVTTPKIANGAVTREKLAAALGRGFICGGTGGFLELAAVGTEYTNPGHVRGPGETVSQFLPVEADARLLVPFAATLKNFVLRTTDLGSENVGETITFTVRKNGVDTDLTVVVAAFAADGTIYTSTADVVVAAGDWLTLKVVGAPTSMQIQCTWAISYEV